MARLNRTDALKRLDGDEELLFKMEGYFLRDYTGYPERIVELIAREAEEAYVLTHSLKNIAASLGAEQLASEAFRLEALLKKGLFEAAGEVVEDLLFQFAPVLEELKATGRGGQDHSRENSGGAGWNSFTELLDNLARAMASFSPDQVDEAMARTAQSVDLIPEEFRETIEEILRLGRDFHYLDGEELAGELKKRVLE
ncbi:MAG: hypothetical protein PQJ60_05765 [Spirochaetales bacterium]|nr:hypothetical protein [Spirochaetales bacterium]